MSKTKTATVASEFEKAKGTIALLKLAMSATHRAIVEKGLLTETELNEAFLKEHKKNKQ